MKTIKNSKKRSKDSTALGPLESESSPSHCFKDSLPIEIEKWAALNDVVIEGHHLPLLDAFFVDEVRSTWYLYKPKEILEYDEFRMLCKWCENNIAGLYSYSLRSIWLSHGEDFFALKLNFNYTTA